MSPKLRFLSGVLAWCLAAYGVMLFGSLPGDPFHDWFGDDLCDLAAD